MNYKHYMIDLFDLYVPEQMEKIMGEINRNNEQIMTSMSTNKYIVIITVENGPKRPLCG